MSAAGTGGAPAEGGWPGVHAGGAAAGGDRPAAPGADASVGGEPAGGRGGRATGAAASVNETPGGGGPAEAAAARRLARVVFALLVVACFAAFIVTQRLKHTPTPVEDFKMVPRFSPTPRGHIKAERISFKLARADRVTVTVLDAAGDTVATLVRGWRVARYKQLSLRWNGREGMPRGQAVVRRPDGTTILTPFIAGQVAPAGEYRVRVQLRDQRRTIPGPRAFTLVR